MTKPRASQSAPSKENSTIKEGCSSITEGRGVGASEKEGKGGLEPQEIKQGRIFRNLSARTSTGRARLKVPEQEEGPQVRKGSGEGIKDASTAEGRPVKDRKERGLERTSKGK